MPPNPPINSRLPRLAVWSGYGTEGAGKLCLRSLKVKAIQENFVLFEMVSHPIVKVIACRFPVQSFPVLRGKSVACRCPLC